MSNLVEFAQCLKDVHLNGVIEECVVTIVDNAATIIAMDLTSSVFVHATGAFEHEDCRFGIGDIARLEKYTSTLNDIEVAVKVNETTLDFKPKSGARVKYKLADWDLVPTFDEAWEEEGDIIETEIEEADYADPLDLGEDSVREFISMMSMLAPSMVEIKSDKRGIVFIHGGTDKEHQFDVRLGKLENIDQLSRKLYGKNITSVLSAIDFGQNPKLYVSGKGAVIIKTDTSSWMLQPLDETAD